MIVQDMPRSPAYKFGFLRDKGGAVIYVRDALRSVKAERRFNGKDLENIPRTKKNSQTGPNSVESATEVTE